MILFLAGVGVGASAVALCMFAAIDYARSAKR
jgi:hypothetical protein